MPPRYCCDGPSHSHLNTTAESQSLRMSLEMLLEYFFIFISAVGSCCQKCTNHLVFGVGPLLTKHWLRFLHCFPNILPTNSFFVVFMNNCVPCMLEVFVERSFASATCCSCRHADSKTPSFSAMRHSQLQPNTILLVLMLEEVLTGVDR